MLESREETHIASSTRTGGFGSPLPKSKLTESELRTDYKRHGPEAEETPYRGTSSPYKSERKGEDSRRDPKKSEPRPREEERRSASSERRQEIGSDAELDRIEAEIKQIGERLREIHLESTGKEPGALEDERRDLRKRLIDLDYEHKMLCARKHIYGKDGPSSSSYSLSSSRLSRLAVIEAELALSRSRRLRELETDLLYDYALDWPSYYDYYAYRPWRSWRYWDSLYLYPSYRSSYYYPYSGYYSSLWWL